MTPTICPSCFKVFEDKEKAELLKALELADAALSGANMKIKAAINKAKGQV